MSRAQLLYPVAKVNDANVASLETTASLSVPWRTLRSSGEAFEGDVKAELGYRSTGIWEVFKGRADAPRATYQGVGELTARSLPELRSSVGPQSFEDPGLKVVLEWIAGQVGMTLQLELDDPIRRHYQLSKTSAWRALQEALASWKVEYVAIELDDNALYIGPEEASPHATAGTQATLEHLKNIYYLAANVGGAKIICPAYPWLRVGHRVELVHPRMSGQARIVEVWHHADRRATTTTLEVKFL